MKRLLTLIVIILCMLPLALRAQETRQLHVMLYPYIPDAGGDKFAGLTARLESEFESIHPDIDLVLTMDQQYNTYDVPTLESLFTDPSGPYPQVIELDLMMLQTLVDNDWIETTSYQTPGAFPVANQAASYGGVLYAVPSRVCSLFLFSPLDVMSISSSDELTVILEQYDPTGQYHNLVGEFFGKTSLTVFYVDFYIGHNGFNSIPNALNVPPDSTIVQEMSELFGECTFQGGNACLGETYQNDPELAGRLLAEGQALAYIGFSEALYEILSQSPVFQSLNIIPAPLGDSINPLVYTDGFTINPANCDEQCVEDFHSFADYYLSVDTQNWMTFAWDVPNSQPRYVLPPVLDFYEQEMVQNNAYFTIFFAGIAGGVPFPTDNYPEAREQLFPDVCEMLDDYMPGDPCQVPSVK